MKPEFSGSLGSRNRAYRSHRRKAGKWRFDRRLRHCLATLAIVGATSLALPGSAEPMRRDGAQNAPRPPVTVSQSEPHSGLRITVLVYNYAHLDSTLLTRAQEVATGIFKQAGIDMAWVVCPVFRADLKNYPACNQKVQTTDFALRLLPASMTQKLPDSDDEALGFAQPCAFDQSGCVVNVFYSSIEALASEMNAQDTRILAHAMAHEIGHLLLGPNAHSSRGLMRGMWSRDDLRLMGWSYLLFTRGQSDRLRANVARRTKLEFSEPSRSASMLKRDYLHRRGLEKLRIVDTVKSGSPADSRFVLLGRNLRDR